jgi:hypothetical protein
MSSRILMATVAAIALSTPAWADDPAEAPIDTEMKAILFDPAEAPIDTEMKMILFVENFIQAPPTTAQDPPAAIQAEVSWPVNALPARRRGAVERQG